MSKHIPVFIIVIGLVLLIASVEQFLSIYRFYRQKERIKRHLVCSILIIVSSVVFLGGGLMWLFIVYNQLY